MARTSRSTQALAERYTYRLAWSASDEEFIATVVEFPSLSWLAESRLEAMQGLTSVVESVLSDMMKQGEAVPQPWDQREFSGKFNVRLGPELHKAIALKAAEQHESMNSFLVKQLSALE